MALRAPIRLLLAVATAGMVGCSRPPEAEPPRASPVRAPVSVAVAMAEARAVPATVEAVGTVRSRRQSVLSSTVVATVLAVHVREGDRVRAGQLLITLDDRDARAQLGRAEAGLREARGAVEEVERSLVAAERAVDVARAQEALAATTLERWRRLVDRELIARQDYDETAARHRVAVAEAARSVELRAALAARRRQTLARLEQAEAEVQAAAITAGYARITAPGDAVVAAKTADIGNLATPGAPLLTLDEERYRLEAAVHESDVPRVGSGQQATVVLDALAREVSGRVVEVVPAADPASRTFTVKIELPALPGLRSGLYGRARFPVGERRVLLVDRRAVTERGQLEAVFVVDEQDRARLRMVKTGRAHGDGVEALAGLGEGERVVLDPGRVVDGDRVAPAR